jgi:hypothetical protein
MTYKDTLESHIQAVADKKSNQQHYPPHSPPLRCVKGTTSSAMLQTFSIIDCQGTAEEKQKTLNF